MATHTFSCIDGHTCGNPVRLVSGGGPRLEGATMLDRRAHFLRDFDWIRTGLMFEPRGHAPRRPPEPDVPGRRMRWTGWPRVRPGRPSPLPWPRPSGSC